MLISDMTLRHIAGTRTVSRFDVSWTLVEQVKCEVVVRSMKQGKNDH